MPEHEHSPEPDQSPKPGMIEVPKFDPPSAEEIEAAKVPRYEDAEAYGKRLDAERYAREAAEVARKEIVDARPVTIIDHTGERPPVVSTVGETPLESREQHYKLDKLSRDQALAQAESRAAQPAKSGGLRGFINRFRGR